MVQVPVPVPYCTVPVPYLYTPLTPLWYTLPYTYFWPSPQPANFFCAMPETFVDRVVRRELARQREEAEQEARESEERFKRADALRKAGTTLLHGGSSNSGGSVGGGKGGGSKASLGGSGGGSGVDTAAPPARPPAAVEVRPMTDLELGAAYEWMSLDQRNGEKRFWGGAASSLQEVHEAMGVGGTCGSGGGSGDGRRLVGAFVAGERFPSGFAATKADGFSVDAMAVRALARGRGVGRALAEHCVATAEAAGARRYEVDALPSAVGFWRALGFARVEEGRLSPTSRVMGKLAGDGAKGTPGRRGGGHRSLGRGVARGAGDARQRRWPLTDASCAPPSAYG